jgi:hypothetical protein
LQNQIKERRLGKAISLARLTERPPSPRAEFNGVYMSDEIKTARQRTTATDIYLEDFLRRAERYQQRLQKKSELKPAKKQKQNAAARRGLKDAVKPKH